MENMEELLERLREGLEELDALASTLDEAEWDALNIKVTAHEIITDLIETVAELDIEINGEPV